MKTITNINQLDLNGVYTYADYLLWKFEERVELLKGRIFKMSPAPARGHQKLSFRLTGEFYKYFEGKKCEVYPAPFDVRLPKKQEENGKIYTVVQPDLCVVCDPNKLDDRGCLGAPDLVIEILSPGNSQKEMKNKFELYEEAGVKEYWVVQPEYENIIIYVLENGKYRGLAPITKGDFVHSHIFPEFKIDTEKIFGN